MPSRWRPSHATVVAYLALFVALSGSSYAATKLSRNAVKSTNIAANAVTSSKVKNGSLLAKDFKAGQLPKGATGATGAAGTAGAAGAAGATGAIGPKGDKGESATALWASVNPDGTLRNGSGVASAGRYAGPPTGSYLVTFNRDISGCAWTATIANHSPVNIEGRVINVAAAGNNSVRVNAGLGGDDFPFDVAVFC